MTLAELLERMASFQYSISYRIVPGDNAASLEKILIKGINSDSRVVKAEELFGVFTTNDHQGADHIDQAVSRGVHVIVLSSILFKYVQSKHYVQDVVWIVHDSPRKVFAKLASVFYGTYPQQCVAVTGTAGKTSVCSLVLQLWKHLGIPSASIGTLGLNHSTEDLVMEYTSTLTTPDPVSMHRCLAQLKQSGTDHIVMEASSHGLDQNRLDGLRFKVAAFTSFSQDHLDYHATMDDYFAAKRRLFEDLIANDGWAVLNADIPEYQALIDVCVMHNHPFYSFGQKGNFIRLVSTALHKQGQRVDLAINNQHHTVHFPLIGSTQLANLLCALTIVLTMGANIKQTLKAIESLAPVPGRLTFAGQHPSGAMIYVDYAHKPQALELVLKDMRRYCKGRLHVVFGCGGDRDKDKRKIMGDIAKELADRIIVTDDNPRTEAPESIRQQILDGCPDAVEIGDRKQAIEYAVASLSADDILIVAGKGHEKHQIIGTEKIPFDDMEIVQSALQAVVKGSIPC